MKQSDLLSAIMFADSTFDRVEADYDEVRLVLTESVGRQVCIRGIAHVGLSWLGHWDESVVERAELLSSDPAIANAIDRVRSVYGDAPPPGGGVRSLDAGWQILRLYFIDGVCIEVVAQRFEVEVLSSG